MNSNIITNKGKRCDDKIHKVYGTCIEFNDDMHYRQECITKKVVQVFFHVVKNIYSSLPLIYLFQSFVKIILLPLTVFQWHVGDLGFHKLAGILYKKVWCFRLLLPDISPGRGIHTEPVCKLEVIQMNAFWCVYNRCHINNPNVMSVSR